MKVADLDYYLPQELIAQQPCPNRDGSRLLVLNRQKTTICDKHFYDIEEYLEKGDCLVVNDTKVLPARFFAKRLSGASLEGLFLNSIDDTIWNVMLKNSRKLKEGEKFILLDKNKQDSFTAIAQEKQPNGTFNITIESNLPLESVLETIGFAPLPPYIKRPGGGDNADQDKQRYQTVFADSSGAVAAPTAGLHFTDRTLKRLTDKGVAFAKATLHVGAGTFKPVTAENVEDHEIHTERYILTTENADIINKAKSNGGRIVAVGTTSVRTLETIFKQQGCIKAASGETNLFITPGFEYKAVDAMLTNFHLPKSTLLALVGAFAGMDFVLKAYKHAVENKYRFFSYGDAMFIE